MEETELDKNAERADIFDHDLGRNAANFVPLSPLSFLKRAADIYPDKIAVSHGDRRYTYREFMRAAAGSPRRCRGAASVSAIRSR